MLDVITDFWKPMSRKAAAPTEEKPLSLDELKAGCIVGFGFVPQSYVSGRRMPVTHVNTYQFGEEKLISYVFAPQNEAAISMIVAQTGGEKYLALSRRISLTDRIKLFDARELESVIDKLDVKTLRGKDGGDSFKGWLVPSYTKQIQGLKGKLSKGDARSDKLTDTQEFEYFLLVSDSNEHAIEIEKYTDGRLEVYATVYRRTSDIGQVTSAESEAQQIAEAKEAKPEPVKVETKLEVKESPKKETPKEVAKEIKPVLVEKAPAPPVAQKPEPSTPKPEKKPMNLASENFGRAENLNGSAKRETKENNMTVPEPNEAIECELNVANKVIEEAIRSETRLSDMLRHILDLPVVRQEAVELPITLSDDDFKLLATRYGISASDKEAIKRRIAQDLNDFSGSKKKVA